MVVRVHGQPAGKEEGSESSDETGPLPVPESALAGFSDVFTTVCAYSTVSFDVSRWKVGNEAPGVMSCENPHSTISNRASDVPQVGEGAYAPSGRRRRNRRWLGLKLKKLLCPGNSASTWFAVSCCRDGLFAVIQPIWVQKPFEIPPMSEGIAATLTCAHPTSNAGTSLGRNCRTGHPSKSSP